jgi:hypothetical protein
MVIYPRGQNTATLHFVEDFIPFRCWLVSRCSCFRNARQWGLRADQLDDVAQHSGGPSAAVASTARPGTRAARQVSHVTNFTGKLFSRPHVQTDRVSTCCGTNGRSAEGAQIWPLFRLVKNEWSFTSNTWHAFMAWCSGLWVHWPLYPWTVRV